MSSPHSRMMSQGDGQTCDRCPAYAPWSIGDYEDDAFSAITRWFACNRHLALVMRSAHWTLDAVEVRYMTADESREAL